MVNRFQLGVSRRNWNSNHIRGPLISELRLLWSFPAWLSECLKSQVRLVNARLPLAVDSFWILSSHSAMEPTTFFSGVEVECQWAEFRHPVYINSIDSISIICEDSILICHPSKAHRQRCLDIVPSCDVLYFYLCIADGKRARVDELKLRGVCTLVYYCSDDVWTDNHLLRSWLSQVVMYPELHWPSSQLFHRSQHPVPNFLLASWWRMIFRWWRLLPRNC